jgi:hypothetical protein
LPCEMPAKHSNLSQKLRMIEEEQNTFYS